MSIYVAIPTLEDSEITNTLRDILTNTTNLNEVHIGVSFTTSKDFYEKVISNFKDYNCFSFRHQDPQNNIGVGIGRLNSYSMYNDEDYFLQIDSHTKFESGWDTTLIELLQKSLIESNNPKTILTGYLGRYSLDSAGNRTLVKGHTFPRYPFFQTGLLMGTSIPSWKDTDLDDVPDSILKTRLFYPATKFNANFSFGNKDFAQFTGLELSSIFFEEEILQTMNLLDAGFSLVFPNQPIPLTHLYSKDLKAPRPTVDSIAAPNTDLISKISANYSSYISDPNNKRKIDIFQKYTGVHPKYGAPSKGKIPSTYRVSID